MKTNALALSGAAAAGLALFGCQPETVESVARPGGGRTITGGQEEAEAGAPALPWDDHAESAGVGGKTCGGPSKIPCPSHEYCDYPDAAPCGRSGATGVCRARPEMCALECPGACGCDGTLYCNACQASAAGADVAVRSSCPARDCRSARDSVASVASPGKMCTAVVRMAYASRSLLSYRLVCAAPGRVSPRQARPRAEADTGFGEGAPLVSGLDPEDELVFWESPSPDGGVAAVSARHGLTVFGGSIVWDGPGRVVFPVAFQPPEGAGPGCGSAAARPPARGIDVRSLDELPAPDLEAALDVVWSTVVPDALARSGVLLDAMVLLYPPSVGVSFDATAAEWVVLLNSGPE
ncbi:MAG: hypothetical protein R3B70_02460 [Polyangiaceae bacterium]